MLWQPPLTPGHRNQMHVTRRDSRAQPPPHLKTFALVKHVIRAITRMFGRLSAAPARLAGLAHRKGAIAEGLDADLTIWTPDAPPPAELHHRHKLTPYLPQDYPGAVAATFLRGRKIYERGSFSAAPLGAILGP